MSSKCISNLIWHSLTNLYSQTTTIASTANRRKQENDMNTNQTLDSRVSRGWAKTSACCLQVSMSCAVLCQIVSLDYLSRSSLHRLAGLPCRLFLSLVVSIWWHARSIVCLWGDWCAVPMQDQLMFLTLLIIFCPLPYPDVDLSVLVYIWCWA